MPRRSAEQVAEGRQTILNAATLEASVHGFRAASIGLLAERVGMSKSGLVRHFGDKEGLQLAALQAGIDLENRTQILSSFTADSREAMTAFLEKRPPNFEGK